MRCDSVLPLLSDFSDRSLSPAATLRVRRHLRTCASCQTAWADAQTFDQNARVLYADKTALPPGLRSHVLSAAPVSVVRPAFRRRSLTQIAVAGVCIAVCLFAVAGLVRFTQTSARPAIAFAQVEAAMQNVQTVHWRETFRVSMREGEPLSPAVTSESWARLEPFALAMEIHSPPSPNFPSVEENTRTVLDNRHLIMMKSEDNTYTLTDFARSKKDTNGRGDSLKSAIISRIISPGEVAKYLQAMPKIGAAQTPPAKPLTWLPKLSAWKSRSVIEAGRSLILFERTKQAWRLPSYISNNIRSFGPTTYQMWVEADTHRVVRYETIEYFPNGRDIRLQTISNQFRYNEKLPPSTWVLVPPPGAKIKRELQRTAQSVWETLSASEKQKIQAAINASDKGWRNGKFEAFASAWDFNYLHEQIPSRNFGPVRRQQWALRVLQQKNNWAKWRSVVIEATTQNFIFDNEPKSAPIASGADNDATFAANAPDVLRVDVTVTGKPKRGNGREWNGPATFYLNRTKTGAYTVVEWDWYSLWMKTAMPSLGAR